MSFYKKVVLALWEDDYEDSRLFTEESLQLMKPELPSLKKTISLLNPDMTKRVRTIDTTYILFGWDGVYWEGKSVDILNVILKDIRHSLIKIDENDAIEKDIKSYDICGSDEEFDYIIAPEADILLWGSQHIFSEIEDYHLLNIFTRVIENCFSDYKPSAIKKILTIAGMTDEDIAHYGFSSLVK